MSKEQVEIDIDEGRRLIKEKRKARQRKRRITALKRFAVFVTILSIITLAVLSLTVFFPVKTISVEEKSDYTAEQIIEASGIKKGQNLWMTGRGAEAKITKALPYISEISVKRVFPSKIVISAKSAEAAICYKQGNEFYICDKNNKLLEVVSEQPENINYIVGLEAKKAKAGNVVGFNNVEKLEILSSILSELSANSINVNTVDISEMADIYFEVEGKFSVTFGSSVNLENKIAHLYQMIQNIDDDLSGKIDLSVWTPENPRGIFTQGV